MPFGLNQVFLETINTGTLKLYDNCALITVKVLCVLCTSTTLIRASVIQWFNHRCLIPLLRVGQQVRFLCSLCYCMSLSHLIKIPCNYSAWCCTRVPMLFRREFTSLLLCDAYKSDCMLNNQANKQIRFSFQRGSSVRSKSL